MQQLGLNGSHRQAVKSFWTRQFQPPATDWQKTFDWTFGVILPVICFVFDPVVFRGGSFGQAILGSYKPFAYLLSFVCVMAMAAALVWGEKLKWLNAVLAGLFIVGVLVSLGVGVVLLPYSLLGLMILIGALGFTPLFSAFVYLRGGIRAYGAARPFLRKAVLVRSFLLTVIFSAVVPYAVNAEIKRLLTAVESGDAEAVRASGGKLKLVAPLVNADDLARQYSRAGEAELASEKMKAVADVYYDLTGKKIEHQARLLMD